MAWALYSRKSNSSGQVACDGRCEACYNLWSQNFQWLSWETLVTKHAEDQSFRDLLKECRDIRSGSKPPPPIRESVVTEGTVRFQLQRSFLAMTEKDMKKSTGLARIPKMATKTLPSMTLQNEHGADETVYVFRDPQEQGRRLLVSTDLATTKQRFDLPSFTHVGQGSSVDNGWSQVAG